MEPYHISTDKSLLDTKLIYAYLSQESYWATGIPLNKVIKSIEHSLCFGIYRGKKQVGFARIISDYATFAYLADVFVLEAHQGKGLAKQLMAFISEHPELQDLRGWFLGTKDAHGLYAQFGFKPLDEPEMFMRKTQNYL